MAKVVAVGEKHLILGFQSVGVEIVPAQDEQSLHRELMHLARDPDVGLVLVTESMASRAPQLLHEFRETAGAVLVVIPSHEGSEGFSFEEIRKAVEHSLGVDILGKE